MTVVRRASTAECLEYGSPRLAEVIPIEAGFSRRPGVRHNRRNIGALVTSASGDGDYSPLDESGGVLWLDMQDTNAFVQDGGTVAQFTNKASDVDWTEATTRPAYAETLNSLPCMDFDGINDLIISTEAAVHSVFAGGGVAYTLIAVAQHDVADSAHRWFGAGNSGSVDGHRSWGTTTTGAGVWASTATSDAGAVANAASAGGSDTSAHIFMWWASTTVVSLSVGNAAADPDGAAQAPGTITPDRAAVGCRPNATPSTFFAGLLGELLLYSVELDADARSRVHDYLADKWNL